MSVSALGTCINDWITQLIANKYKIIFLSFKGKKIMKQKLSLSSNWSTAIGGHRDLSWIYIWGYRWIVKIKLLKRIWTK